MARGLSEMLFGSRRTPPQIVPQDKKRTSVRRDLYVDEEDTYFTPSKREDMGTSSPEITMRRAFFYHLWHYPKQTLGHLILTIFVVIFLMNALFLQSAPPPAPFTRHPLPPSSLQAESHPQAVTIRPPDRPLPSASSLRPEDMWSVPATPSPPLEVKPTHPPSPLSEKVSEKRSADPMGELVRSTLSSAPPKTNKNEPDKVVLAVQRALLKLGMAPKDMKLDGIVGSTTHQAIEKFERKNNMPIRGEISPKVIRLLSMQSGLSIP